MILLINLYIVYNVNIFIHKLKKAPIFLSVIVNLNIWFFLQLHFFLDCKYQCSLILIILRVCCNFNPD